MRKLSATLLALGLTLAASSSAWAHDSFSIGFNVGVPMYSAPPPVRYYPAPPVVYYPAAPTVYYAPPPVYYRSNPNVYFQYGRGWGDGREWGHHHEWREHGRGGW